MIREIQRGLDFPDGKAVHGSKNREMMLEMGLVG